MFTRLISSTAVFVVSSLLPSSVSFGEMRTWVDSSGEHRVEAEFVNVKDGKVTLRNSDGKRLVLPLARLSEEDQAFVRQHPASGRSDSKETSAARNPARARPIARRFFNALIDQELDDIKPLLTPKGQTNWESVEPLLEELDVPDSRRSVLVRTAKTDGTYVNVNVSVKVKGKYHKQLLQFQWFDNRWRLAALIPDGEDADPIRFDSDGRGRDSSDRQRDDDEFDDENE